jgi:hypothetical protein
MTQALYAHMNKKKKEWAKNQKKNIISKKKIKMIGKQAST